MKKSLLLVLIVIITIALTYALIHYMGMRGFPFALSLNFLLMACVLIFLETMKSQLISPYFRLDSRSGKGVPKRILIPSR